MLRKKNRRPQHAPDLSRHRHTNLNTTACPDVEILSVADSEIDGGDVTQDQHFLREARHSCDAILPARSNQSWLEHSHQIIAEIHKNRAVAALC